MIPNGTRDSKVSDIYQVCVSYNLNYQLSKISRNVLPKIILENLIHKPIEIRLFAVLANNLISIAPCIRFQSWMKMWGHFFITNVAKKKIAKRHLRPYLNIYIRQIDKNSLKIYILRVTDSQKNFSNIYVDNIFFSYISLGKNWISHQLSNYICKVHYLTLWA